MTRDEALEQAIEACTAVMLAARDHQDIETARAASDAQRLLIGRRSALQVARMERDRGLQKQCAPR